MESSNCSNFMNTVRAIMREGSWPFAFNIKPGLTSKLYHYTTPDETDTCFDLLMVVPVFILRSWILQRNFHSAIHPRLWSHTPTPKACAHVWCVACVWCLHNDGSCDSWLKCNRYEQHTFHAPSTPTNLLIALCPTAQSPVSPPYTFYTFYASVQFWVWKNKHATENVCIDRSNNQISNNGYTLFHNAILV